MPLILVRRPGRTAWYMRGTVAGQSVFESTGTAERDRAEQQRAKREAALWQRSVYGHRTVATFAEAVDSYLAAAPRAPNQAALVGKLLAHFATTPLAQINQTALDRAYAVLLRPTAAPATRLRNVLTPLRAILEHAGRRGWCDRPAFEVPRQPRPRVTFLRPAEATRLVQAAAPHLRPLLVFLIGTGARMSEALELDWTEVDLVGRRATALRSKTGAERQFDLPPVVVAALAALPHREGRVFRPARRANRALRQLRERRGTPPAEAGWIDGEQYADNNRTSGGQIKRAWASACRAAGLPGQWHTWQAAGKQHRIWQPELHPHDLRHTWATWRYAIDRDLLALQHAGGWSSVTQVQIYAHLLPAAYRDAAAAWLSPARRAPTLDKETSA